MKSSSPSAFHNFVGRPEPSRCYPNTRVVILDGLERWIQGQELENHPIKWLNGGAGAGKSAVAQTFAERCESLGYIVASFFFFRPDDTRNHAGSLFPTIAYQVARGYPTIQASMEAVIQQDPNIFNQDLRKQIASLIMRPFLESKQDARVPQCIVIIDGLDECIEEEMQACIVDAISGVVSSAMLEATAAPIPRFLICSRSEDTILRAFRSPSTSRVYTEVNLSNDERADQDILTFLMAQFNEIKETHRRKDLIPSQWPTKKDVRFLQSKSSGHFIYAKTAMRFISNHIRPVTALKVILGLDVSPQSSCQPFAELDMLFQHILRRALISTNIYSIRTVLGFFALSGGVATEYHRDVLEAFLGLAEGTLDTLLVDLASLISAHGNMGPAFLHKSFHDFLQDSSRARDFFIEPRDIQSLIWTRRCHLIAERWNSERGQFGSWQQDPLYLFIEYSLVTDQYMETPAWTPELHHAMEKTRIESIWKFCGEYHSGRKSERFEVIMFGRELAMWDYLLQVMNMMLEASTDSLFLAARHLLVDAVEDVLDIFCQMTDDRPDPDPPCYPVPALRRDIAWSILCDVMDRRQSQPHPNAVRRIFDILTKRPFDRTERVCAEGPPANGYLEPLWLFLTCDKCGTNHRQCSHEGAQQATRGLSHDQWSYGHLQAKFCGAPRGCTQISEVYSC